MFTPDENIKLNNFTIMACLYYKCGYISKHKEIDRVLIFISTTGNFLPIVGNIRMILGN
jgi:hypothetical protein